MTKLSKLLWKKHEKAVELVQSDHDLTDAERLFVLQHWSPLAQQNVGVAGIYFTPLNLAYELMIEVGDTKTVLDMCAGTGRLAYACWQYNNKEPNITCIENNHEFVEVGKRVLPEAKWIHADAFDWHSYHDRHYYYHHYYDVVICNPPYGLRINKQASEYVAAMTAMALSDRAVFILPHNVLPFRYSGQQVFKQVENKKYEKWSKEFNIKFEMNCGIDVSIYRNDWQGVKPAVEIVLVSKIEKSQRSLF